MVNRLVLGCGAVGFDLLEETPRREGLTVVTADASRAETLRDMDVDAVAADPADTDVYPPGVDVVVVAGSHPKKNLRTARQAAAFYPDALLVVYAGTDAPPAILESVEAVADRVIDPVVAVADRVLDAAHGPASDRVRRLRRVLTTAEAPLAVVSHDNPDPDALASALALTRIAEKVGLEADACYYGEISHQENRALVNLLDLPLVNLEDDDIDDYGSVALVDHSRPGVNDSLPPETMVDVVIDHHPPRGPVEGRFVDLRSDVGATSTLLASYLKRFDVDPDEQVATALLYGIQIDTKDFTREVSETDFEAAAYLLDWVDEDVLERVESPSVSLDTMEVLARAIDRRRVTNGALSSCVGEIRDRDALAQAAERLLDMEGVHTSLVYGFMDGTVYVSGRTRGADLDLGETLREAFGRIGSAGGHADMAGAQIPMGILADVGEGSRTSLREVVRAVIDERFFGILIDAPTAPTADAELAFEYDEVTNPPFLHGRRDSDVSRPDQLPEADDRDSDDHDSDDRDSDDRTATDSDSEDGTSAESDAGGSDGSTDPGERQSRKSRSEADGRDGSDREVDRSDTDRSESDRSDVDRNESDHVEADGG